MRIRFWYQRLVNHPYWWVFITLGVFCLLELFSISRHEMWRDELHSWMVTKQTGSFVDLFYNKRYEGHPSLWYVILFPLTRFTDHYQYMAYLHLAIALLSYFVFLRFAPFPLWQKVLIIFGYFFVFEYGLLSRNYQIELLCIFLYCTLFNNRVKPVLWIALILAVQCQSNFFGMLVAVLLAALYLLTQINIGFIKTRKWVLLGAVCIFLAGLVLSLKQMTPPPDSGYAVGWHFTPYSNFGKAFTTVFKSYFPIPTGYHFWNSHWVLNKTAKMLFSMAIMALVSIQFVERRRLLLFFWLANLSLWMFFYTKHYGYIRHHGQVYLLLIICLWLKPYFAADSIAWSTLWQRYKDVLMRISNAFLVILFCTQLAIGMYVLARDWRDPFSGSAAAADYILANHLENMPMVGYKDQVASAVGARLNKPMYYVSQGAVRSFILFNKGWNDKYPVVVSIYKALQYAAQKQKDVLLILNQPIMGLFRYPYIHQLACFKHSIVEDEVYYLYRVEYIPTLDKQLNSTQLEKYH